MTTARRPRGRARLAVALVAAAVASLAPRAQAAEPAAMAPDIVRTDLGGRPFRLSALRGEVVLLSFWASWCEPCITDLPRFASWARRYRRAGLRVVGVSLDDEPAAARRALTRYRVGYPVLMFDARLGTDYGGVYGLPLTLVIDTDGRIVARYSGAPDLAALEAQVRTLLAGRRG